MLKSKLIKSLTIFAIIFESVFFLSYNSYAEVLNTKLNVIQNASETKYLENEQGNISKRIIDSNPEQGDVTIELKLSNLKKENENKKVYENTEIYLLVSENISSDSEKLSKSIANIESLSTKILNKNSKTKIGVIGIKGTISDIQKSEDGKNAIIGENDEGDKDGMAEDAEIVAAPTNDVESIKKAIQDMNASKTKYNTNLQAAIRMAKNNYSNEVNKILICLYDAVPDIAIGVHHKVSFGGFSLYNTVEEAVIAQHELIADKTHDEIVQLRDKQIDFFILRPDDTSYDETWYNETTGEKILDFDGSSYVKKIYGTVENPTYGKIYSFTKEALDTIIRENIFNDVEKIIQSDIQSIKIVDYFPSDITENFEFCYIGTPSVGATSEAIDKKNNTITWNIDTLKGNEVATLKYKLKLKDMNNTALLNKTIATNEKVVLTYKDLQEKDYTVVLDSSPKIQLTEVKEESSKSKDGENSKNDDKDGTIARGSLPNTGKSTIVLLAGISIAIFSIFTYVKVIKSKDIK